MSYLHMFIDIFVKVGRPAASPCIFVTDPVFYHFHGCCYFRHQHCRADITDAMPLPSRVLWWTEASGCFFFCSCVSALQYTDKFTGINSNTAVYI